MKSFGIWYSSSDIQEHYPVEHSFPISAEKEPELDLHINLWDISGKRAKSAAPFIDIGMNISEFRKIDKLCFLIPFGVDSSGIVDLTDTFEKKSIANLVFNDDCRFTRNENGFCVLELMEHEGKKKLLYNMAEAEVDFWNEDETMIKFDLKVLREDSVCDEFHDLYIRFRILSDRIKEELFCNIKSKNWFLESGFTSTQVVDIKVNKKRNMNEEDIKEMRRNKFQFAEFNKVHFLVMEPAGNDVEVFGKDFIECRKLESEWGEYLKLNFELGDILAYHWKTVSESEQLKEYAQMVKVTSAATSWFIIIVYMLVVVALGILTNSLFAAFVQPLLGL